VRVGKNGVGCRHRKRSPAHERKGIRRVQGKKKKGRKERRGEGVFPPEKKRLGPLEKEKKKDHL